jgi:hypothetical protein
LTFMVGARRPIAHEPDISLRIILLHGAQRRKAAITILRHHAAKAVLPQMGSAMRRGRPSGHAIRRATCLASATLGVALMVSPVAGAQNGYRVRYEQIEPSGVPLPGPFTVALHYRTVPGVPNEVRLEAVVLRTQGGYEMTTEFYEHVFDRPNASCSSCLLPGQRRYANYSFPDDIAVKSRESFTASWAANPANSPPDASVIAFPKHGLLFAGRSRLRVSLQQATIECLLGQVQCPYEGRYKEYAVNVHGRRLSVAVVAQGCVMGSATAQCPTGW